MSWNERRRDHLQRRHRPAARPGRARRARRGPARHRGEIHRRGRRARRPGRRRAFCVAPKPPNEDNAASEACLDAAHLASLGSAPAVTAAVPAEACLDFGPETPPGNFRPRDADASGGYYQPIRADVGELVAFGLSRITCKLATAPGAVAHDYDVRYIANHNPTLEPLVLLGPSGSLAPSRVPPDTDITLTASWPPDAAETYLYYQPLSQTLGTRREAMRLSWFATGGTLGVDASSIGEADATRSVSTLWHTPAPGRATLWLVLRDSRGGIASHTVHIDIAP